MTQPDESPKPAEQDPGDQLVLNSPDEANSLKDFLLWSAVILIATLTAYSPALHGRFLWDDNRHIEDNRDLRDANGLEDIWTGHWKYLFAGPDQRAKLRIYTPQYYPLTHTTYWLEYQLSGSTPNDINLTIFHVTNIVLHAAGAILLWFILRELSVPGAWVAAAIFALHPIEAESVAWMSERKNVLAGVFFFACILTYLKSPFGPKHYGEKDEMPYYLASLALFVGAVLSKTVACSAPAVILLLIWWKRGRIGMRDLLATAPMFVIGLMLSWFTSWIERNFVHAPPLDLSFAQHVLVAGNAVWFYVAKLLWPVKLTFIYPQWNLARTALWIQPVALVAVIVALAALARRIGRAPLVAVLIFTGVLLPALGFFRAYPLRYAYVADHFQYLAGPALIALIVATAAVVIRRIAPSIKLLPHVLAGVLLGALLVFTLMRSSVFASPVDLWRDTVAKNSSSPMVHSNYGQALFAAAQQERDLRDDERAKLYDEAAQQLADAVKLYPEHSESLDKALTLWGRILLLRGKPGEAMQKFDRAAAIGPQNFEALLGRGEALMETNRVDDAIKAFRAALATAEAQKPYVSRETGATVVQALARALAAHGDRAEAIMLYQRAIKAVGERPSLHREYGDLLRDAGNKTDAAREYAIAITLDPTYIDARIALARLMISVGNLQGAQQQLRAAALTNSLYPPVLEASKEWASAMAARDASTRPSTTRSATGPATGPATTAGSAELDKAVRKLMRTQDIRSEVYTAPATQPSR